MRSNEVDTVHISKEMLEAVESIPDMKKQKVITPEMEEVIMLYYDKKPKRKLAKLLGISEDRMRSIYEEATGEKE